MAFVIRTAEQTWNVPGHCQDGFKYVNYLDRVNEQSYTTAGRFRPAVFATREEAETKLAELRSLLARMGGDDGLGWHVAEFDVGRITDELKAAVRESGLSEYALAKFSEVSQSVISRWMCGKRDITLRTADKIRTALASARYPDFVRARLGDE